MFTGIIEEIGSVMQLATVKDAQQLTILCNKVLEDLKLGDSIAINGVCLTVTVVDNSSFSVDVMPETFRCTSLSKIALNVEVNLERAVGVGGRFGGHFVSGHVDGVGEIIAINPNNNAVNYEIKLASELLKYCLPKGSIAVDGTSLTIFKVRQHSISLSLIPHTLKNSVLGRKQVGDLVNIENDMLAKYVANLSAQQLVPNPIITTEFLQQKGFI